MNGSRLTTVEPTSLLAVSPAWAAFRNGELPGYRHGHRTLRFKITDLDAWMSAAEVNASNVPVRASGAGLTSGFRTNPSRRGRPA